jgi:uncharacterized protein YdiU (UPF0061 family)
MIGSLMNVMSAAKSDFANAMGVLSQYNSNPRHDHIVAVKQVFRYFNGTKNWCQHFVEALAGALRGALGDSTLAGDAVGAYRY